MSRKHYVVDTVEAVPSPEAAYAWESIDEFSVDGVAGVDESAMQRLEDEGFLRVRGVLDPARLAAAKDALSELVDRGLEDDGRCEFAFESLAKGDLEKLQGDERLDAVRKLMNFVQQQSFLDALSHDAVILGLVERALGAKPKLFQDMALFKPPHIGREKPWHQDQAYFDLPEGTKVVGLWIALDDASVENGCMHFVPGRHKEGAVPHFNVRDWQICDDYAVENRVVAAPVEAGDMLIFDSMTPHGTPTNNSPMRRRSLQFHYCGDHVELLPNSDERVRIFGGDGMGLTC